MRAKKGAGLAGLPTGIEHEIDIMFPGPAVQALQRAVSWDEIARDHAADGRHHFRGIVMDEAAAAGLSGSEKDLAHHRIKQSVMETHPLAGDWQPAIGDDISSRAVEITGFLHG